eukprot:6205003-Pleurochrysis_carterae.AAC.4
MSAALQRCQCLYCRAHTNHLPFARLALLLMDMLVVCEDAFTLSRPALSWQRRVGTNALSRRALVEMKGADWSQCGRGGG